MIKSLQVIIININNNNKHKIKSVRSKSIINEKSEIYYKSLNIKNLLRISKSKLL